MVAKIRRDGEPIGHLIPISTDAYEEWQLEKHLLNETTPEARAMFKQWIDFNHKQYTGEEGLEPMTYRMNEKGTLKIMMASWFN